MKTTKEMIEVMQAAEKGKRIEALSRFSDGAVWVSDPKPSWDWVAFDYRVTREPRVIWAIFRPPGETLLPKMSFSEDESHARLFANANGYELAKFVEVMP